MRQLGGPESPVPPDINSFQKNHECHFKEPLLSQALAIARFASRRLVAGAPTEATEALGDKTSAKLLAKASAGIHYTEHLEGDGAAIFAHACKLGAEGIVSKHREHTYRSGPSKAWLKTKNPRAPGMLRFRDEP